MITIITITALCAYIMGIYVGRHFKEFTIE